MNDSTKLFVVVVLFVCLVLVLLVAPFFTIWSVNSLFRTEIELSFANYCAVLWLMTIVRGITIAYNKN